MTKNGCVDCQTAFTIQDGMKKRIVWAGSDVGHPTPLCKVCAKHHFGAAA